MSAYASLVEADSRLHTAVSELEKRLEPVLRYADDEITPVDPSDSSLEATISYLRSRIARLEEITERIVL